MEIEYIDVVNEYNEIIGQERRSTVHKSGLWHRGVHIFLFTLDGRLLVQKRSHTETTYPGTLDCSVSEHLGIGESYLHGAKRGLQEELGLCSVELKQVAVFKIKCGLTDNMFNALYEGIYSGESINPNQSEIEQIYFHTIPELRQMLCSVETPFAPWFRKLLLWYAGEETDIQEFP